MANDTQSRRISFYPNRYYNKLLTAYAFDRFYCKSEAEKEINKKFFDSMSDQDKARLLKIYDSMSPEQRNKPKRA